MNTQVLHVRVGEDLPLTLERAAQAMRSLEKGEHPTPNFELGFENVAQFFSVFTPKRWELLAALREHGPISIFSLARLLHRDYKNVHADISALIEWTVVDKTEDNLVYAPFEDISVDVHLPAKQAA